MPPPRLKQLVPHSSSSTFLFHLHTRPCPFLYPLLTRTSLNAQPHHPRHASHATQGRANKASQGPGKRLGLKRAATELVVPGTIIFRQRGTRWFPGENVGMGRDHTIFAKEKGYVVYYKAPWKGMGYGGAGRIRANPGSGGMHYKKFIGIVYNRGDTLPRPEGRERDRRLGMVVRQRKDFGQVREGEQQDISGLTSAGTTIGSVTKEQRAAMPVGKTKGYQIRESNISIGRSVDKKLRVRTFRRGDRWLAWRKRSKRARKVKEAKAQKKARKGKGAEKAARSGDLRAP